MKKLIIILAIVIIIFASLLGYFYFFHNSASTPAKIVESISNLFPGSESRDIPIDPLFPNSNDSENQPMDGSYQIENTSLNSKFQKISNNAIAGASEVTIKATSTKNLPSNLIWYIEKATGYVFSYDPSTATQRQITNTTWVGGQEAYWGESKGAPTFILRRNKNSNIENYLAKITNQASTTNSIGELTGISIDSNISSLYSSPKKDRYFYLISTPSGSVGYLNGFAGTGLPTQIFSSVYSKWQVSWPEENTLIFQSAPISNQNGMLYSFNLKTKGFTRLLGGVPGLTSLVSPSTKKILYTDNTLKLKIKTLDKEIPDFSLELSSLPEKCTWTKDSAKLYCSIPNSLPFGEYPDTWYQGLVNFSDSIWEINALTGTAKQIYNPANDENKQAIDGVNLFLTKNQDKLFLTNKNDYTLWQLKLSDSFNATST